MASRPQRRRRAGAVRLAPLLLALTFASACDTTGGSRVRRASERRNSELFEDLISRGTMQPADDFDEEAYFERLAEEYADEPRPEDLVPPVEPEPPEDAAVADPDAPAPDPDAGEGAAEPAPEPPLNPYLEFGQQIVWYPLREGDTERLIMKPYAFPVGMGKKVFELISTYGPFPIHAAIVDGEAPAELGAQPTDSVVIDLREGWIVESYTAPRNAGLASPQPVPLGDTLFVTATADLMTEVEHFIDLFAADVRQIEIEAKIVEVTTRDTLDLGVRRVEESTPIFGLPNPGTFVQSVDFSFGNAVDTTEALFELGAVFDGVTFNALLEAVASFENVSIISRPKVAVREGARAEIVNTTSIPFFTVQAINAAGNFTTNLTFKEVGVQMYVIPRVIGRNTVILNIDIEASQQTGTAITLVQGAGNGGQVVTVPQISSRMARTIVRLEPGQAVILGGLISERTTERESKMPILGDVPVLGNLFKSTSNTKEQTNVLFFIRPRILEGSDLNSPFE